MQAAAQPQESLVDSIELAMERVLQGGHLGPIGGRGRSELLQRQDLAQPEDRHGEALSESIERLIQAHGEGKSRRRAG